MQVYSWLATQYLTIDPPLEMGPDGLLFSAVAPDWEEGLSYSVLQCVQMNGMCNGAYDTTNLDSLIICTIKTIDFIW